MEGLFLDIPLDNTLDLFERIAENQSMWPIDREAQRKTAEIHSINALTTVTDQLEVLTKEVEQTNSEYEHGLPTSIDLQGLWGRSYNCKLSFSLHACLSV